MYLQFPVSHVLFKTDAQSHGQNAKFRPAETGAGLLEGERFDVKTMGKISGESGDSSRAVGNDFRSFRSGVQTAGAAIPDVPELAPPERHRHDRERRRHPLE